MVSSVGLRDLKKEGVDCRWFDGRLTGSLAEGGHQSGRPGGEDLGVKAFKFTKAPPLQKKN